MYGRMDDLTFAVGGVVITRGQALDGPEGCGVIRKVQDPSSFVATPKIRHALLLMAGAGRV